MTISELSKDELSRWTAEKMEPFAGITESFMKEYRKFFGDQFRLPHEFGHSSGGFWWFVIYYGDGKFSGNPVAYDRPEIAIWLLKWLLGHSFEINDHRVYGQTVEPIPFSTVRVLIRDNDIERALAEAVALALGWKDHKEACKHDHLDMEGICHRCGEDRRGG